MNARWRAGKMHGDKHPTLDLIYLQLDPVGAHVGHLSGFLPPHEHAALSCVLLGECTEYNRRTDPVFAFSKRHE